MVSDLTFIFYYDFLIFKSLFILRERERERKRERERTQVGEGQGERGRGISSRLHTVSVEPDSGLDPKTCEVMT